MTGILRQQAIDAVWAAIDPSSEGNFRLAAEAASKVLRDLPIGVFADEDEGPEFDPGQTRPCPGHEFACTGTAYGGDDESYFGEGRSYCIHCGADGDA